MIWNGNSCEKELVKNYADIVLGIEYWTSEKKTVGVQYTSQMFDISLNSMPDIVIVFVSYLFMQQSQILGTKKNKVFFMVGLWLD